MADRQEHRLQEKFLYKNLMAKARVSRSLHSTNGLAADEVVLAVTGCADRIAECWGRSCSIARTTPMQHVPCAVNWADISTSRILVAPIQKKPGSNLE